MTYQGEKDNIFIKFKYNIKFLKMVFKQLYVLFLIILALASFDSYNTSLGLSFLIRGKRIQSTNSLGISAVVFQRNTFLNI